MLIKTQNYIQIKASGGGGGERKRQLFYMQIIIIMKTKTTESQNKLQSRNRGKEASVSADEKSYVFATLYFSIEPIHDRNDDRGIKYRQ